MKLLQTIKAIAHLPIDLFAPDHRRPAPGEPRIIRNRGLGVHERNAVWIDRDGDLWRFNVCTQEWEYEGDAGWISAMTGPAGYTSGSYAPYQERLAEPIGTK